MHVHTQYNTYMTSISKVLFTLGESFLRTTTDLTLLTLCYFVLACEKKSSAHYYRCAEKALRFTETVNYDAIKRTLHHLTTNGLITRTKKRSILDVTITHEGKKRFNELLPIYKIVRPWDKHVYLVSYDIPIQANIKRNLLRDAVRTLGGALLQESLWVIPYNPTDVLGDLAAAKNIPGTLLVSKFGTDGSIGNESLQDLIFRVYRLSALKDRYEAFLEKFPKKSTAGMQALVTYLQILHDDPQLPFELLPRDFPDKKAYERIQSLTPLHRMMGNFIDRIN
jgi:DNA-binding transcriptional regulator PaaX